MSWCMSVLRRQLVAMSVALWVALPASAAPAVVPNPAPEHANTEQRAIAPEGPSSTASGRFGAKASAARTRQTDEKPSTAAPVALSQRAAAAGDLGILFPEGERRQGDTAYAVRIVLGLTLLAIIPSLLVCLTAFLRISIVLSMLRHAIGMPETPPNTVLIGLALFLTLFTMNPVLQVVNSEALQPFMQGKLSIQQGIDKAARPLREFMVRQTREQDLALMVELSKSPAPSTVDDIGNLQLIPAFMLSELRAAFQIGFVIFLPFLLIDLIVSSILMALGMMMMPPVTIALPVKILMFILVDGWSLIVKGLVGSFH